MSSITEQFSAATKSQLETQFNVINAIASTAVDSAEKIISLHLNAGKATLEKGTAAAKQLLDDPKELFSLAAIQPPSFDKLSAYGKELFDIATQAQNALIKAATQFKDAATAAAPAAPAPLLAAVKTAAPAAAAPAAAAPAVAVEIAAEAEPAPLAKPAAKLKAAVEAVAEVEQATPVSAVPPAPLAAPVEEPAPVEIKSVAPGKAKPAVKAPPKK